MKSKIFLNFLKLIVITSLFILFSGCGSSVKVVAEVSTQEMLDDVEYFVVTSREHTDEDVDYPMAPAAGGDHLGIWHNCGIYKVELLEEAAVHSLEHGAVWITYKPDISVEELIKLNTTFSGEEKILISPYPQQKSPIVATAWARRLEVESVDDLKLSKFIEYFIDGEAAPEAGITCARGIGRPPNDPFFVNR